MNNFKILHIVNNYSASEVYKNLIRELDGLGIQQIVYNPVRSINLIGRNEIKLNTSGSRIEYRYILNKITDRIFYPIKIKKIVRDIQKRVDLTTIDVIHAHTWYSDGGAAYILSKKYKIPYIVAIRNTDLNLFQRKLIYLRPFGRKILQKSLKVILITRCYKKRILEQASLEGIKALLEEKMSIIPNGVDPFWIENAREKPNNKNIGGSTFHILFIGQFTRSKNIFALQEAVKLLSREENGLVCLHIVGGGGEDTKKVMANIDQFPHLFRYYGKIYNKVKLKEILRYCDIFAMPSRHETFGLVYVEALLQGLPILYRRGEGIDGFYDEKIGEMVTKKNILEIKEKLKLMHENYKLYSINTPVVIENHDWGRIARQYVEIYSGR